MNNWGGDDNHRVSRRRCALLARHCGLDTQTTYIQLYRTIKRNLIVQIFPVNSIYFYNSKFVLVFLIFVFCYLFFNFFTNFNFMYYVSVY